MTTTDKHPPLRPQRTYRNLWIYHKRPCCCIQLARADFYHYLLLFLTMLGQLGKTLQKKDERL